MSMCDAEGEIGRSLGKGAEIIWAFWVLYLGDSEVIMLCFIPFLGVDYVDEYLDI